MSRLKILIYIYKISSNQNDQALAKYNDTTQANIHPEKRQPGFKIISVSIKYVTSA